jgi:hypothetical protein
MEYIQGLLTAEGLLSMHIGTILSLVWAGAYSDTPSERTSHFIRVIILYEGRCMNGV